MTDGNEPPRLDPARLSPGELARLLSAAAGRPIDEAIILADLASGAPRAADGTMNLLHYAAWLAARLNEEGGI